MSCAIRFRPKRVLELADELRLSESQRAAVRAAFEHMHAEPVRLGDRILAAEAELDRLFGDARADADSVNAQVAAIAGCRASCALLTCWRISRRAKC